MEQDEILAELERIKAESQGIFLAENHYQAVKNWIAEELENLIEAIREYR